MGKRYILAATCVLSLFTQGTLWRAGTSAGLDPACEGKLCGPQALGRDFNRQAPCEGWTAVLRPLPCLEHLLS